MKSTKSAFFIAMASILLAIIVMPVSAVSITESPSHLERGDLVTVTISGLNDGSRFSLSIEGVFGTQPGTETTFQTSNFNMPISLAAGTLSAATRGTEWTELSVKKGTTTVNLLDAADSSGFYSVSQSYAVSSGIFTYLKLRVKSRTDASRISTQLNLAGTKQGPEDSQITFNVDGIDNGQVTVIAMVDGTQVLSKTITVGSGMAPVQTTTTPAPAATTSATTPVPTITILTPSATTSGQSDTVLTQNNTTPIPTLTARIRSADSAATTPGTPAGTPTTSVPATAPAGTVTPATSTEGSLPQGSTIPQDTAAAPATTVPWLPLGSVLALGALIVVFLVVRFHKRS